MLIVPLPYSELSNVVANPDEVYEFSYKDSKVKGRPFIYYLSNLGLKTKINIEELSCEELASLLNEYMMVNVLFRCEELNALAMVALMRFLNVEMDGVLTATAPEGFFEYFIATHEETLTWYFAFCSSMIGYCRYIRDYADQKPHDLSEYEGVIDDPRVIGINVVWLFELPPFFELLFSAPVDLFPQYFFHQQFEERIFNGRKLINFFLEGDAGRGLMMHYGLSENFADQDALDRFYAGLLSEEEIDVSIYQ